MMERMTRLLAIDGANSYQYICSMAFDVSRHRIFVITSATQFGTTSLAGP